MIYPQLFAELESKRWSLGSDVPWHTFQADQITRRQLEGIKMNALLEWSAMPTAEMFLRDNPDDADFSAFMSIWFFEEQKHSLLLMEYLRHFAPDLVPTEQELSRVRFEFDPAPALDSLALHFFGEVRLNQWYRCAREWHTEPVIRHVYQLLATDEARHARAYFRYMERALERQGQTARLAFAKVGVLMCNPRLNKVMHPTNLHVNKSMYPNDRVCDQLPDPGWFARWLSDEIGFGDVWEAKVMAGILKSLSALFGVTLESPEALRQYRTQLRESLGDTNWRADSNRTNEAEAPSLSDAHA